MNSSEALVNSMIIADVEGLKFDLLILQKKVEIALTPVFFRD